MLDDSYCVYLNFPIDMPQLISEINKYVQFKINDFYLSPNNQFRINFQDDLGKKIRSIMPFKISDMGVYQNSPGWDYSIHKDTIRKFAINMLISDENPDFEVNFLNEDKTEKYPVPYVKNQFVLLNTQKFHYVKNNSKNISRFCVSIGCTSVDYDTVKNTFIDNKNIGLYPY
jgi:hypothetical protein